MVDVPRHLPRTQLERIRNVARTHAALSGGGSTAAARPVTQGTSAPQVYRAPGTGGAVKTGDSSGENSVAIASTTTDDGGVTATGADAVAIGYGAHAGGFLSVALGGLSTSADGADGAICIGWNALASGDASIAIGTGGTSAASTRATGTESVAIGPQAQASGSRSVAIGADAAASGDDQIALGSSHVVIVRGSLCLADSAGNLHQVVVSTGGALSTVAYP